MNMQDMEYNAEKATALLSAMSNKHRLMILCRLVGGEASVGQLTETLGLRQATVSQHLARLRELELVQTRRDAQTIFYSLNGGEAKAVIETLYGLYCGTVDEPAKETAAATA